MAALLPYLRLLRAGALFSPAADVVAGVCMRGLEWSPDAVRATVASVCLYAAGMVWNDVADLRVDRVQRPERPLPRGDVGVPAAILLGTLLIAAGLLLSPNVWHHGAIALLVLAYDFGSKRFVVAGALTMGLLRGLNLLTAAAIPLAAGAADAADGAIAAAYGYSRNALAAAGCYAIYIVGVTILGIFEDQKHVRPRAIVGVQAAPMLAALIGIAIVEGDAWPAPAIALPFVILLARRNRLVAVWDQAAIRRSMTWLLLGTMLYTALLCVAADRPVEALAIAACIPVARRIARAISLT